MYRGWQITKLTKIVQIHQCLLGDLRGLCEAFVSFEPIFDAVSQ
jgi:hypothetical protein